PIAHCIEADGRIAPLLSATRKLSRNELLGTSAGYRFPSRSCKEADYPHTCAAHKAGIYRCVGQGRIIDYQPLRRQVVTQEALYTRGSLWDAMMSSTGVLPLGLRLPQDRMRIRFRTRQMFFDKRVSCCPKTFGICLFKTTENIDFFFIRCKCPKSVVL